MIEAREYPLTADDGIPLALTRLNGGPKGPLLVVHGAGVASTMFRAPTLREPFADYLARNGWDVWLLDWRASIRLPFRQLTLDDSAQFDFPAACRAILAETRADSLQAMVHCVGSISFFLSASRGLVPMVRSIVASQVALHYRIPPATMAKTAIHLPEVMSDLGFDSLSAHEDPQHPIFQRAFDAMLDAIHHECTSRICHRITFMFGLLWQHANLSAAMHDTEIGELFGRCNLTTYRHLAQLTRAGSGQAYDFDESENQRRYGQSTPPSDLRPESFRRPIAFVHGEHNRTFLPESTELTYDWLRAQNGPELYQRRMTAGYGHIDNYLGARSDIEVYPIILDLLEGHWARR
jgi:hypothetical protein